MTGSFRLPIGVISVVGILSVAEIISMVGIISVAVQGLDSREITSLPDIKKVIYMARHFNHRRK